ELKNNINGIQESLDSSIQWFKDNSEFPVLEEFGIDPEKASLQDFFAEVENNCIKRSSSFDTLNLGCVSYVMETTLSFEYKLEGQDKLYSLKEMIYRNGGDCEDYSLFLKALMNHLEKEYQEKELIIQAWKETPQPDNYVVYEIGGKKLFYPGAEAHDLGEVKKLGPYMICYTTKYDGVSFEGHCVVALSKEQINKIDDLVKLDGAKTFEPQDGSYKGIVGTDYYVCQDDETDCDKGINNISFVISDSDLYQFVNGEWTSYARYKDDLTSLNGRIEGFLKGVN
ncbi:hypothetical protein HYT84_04400, partial [Candidatus Micrarchaeota archaeon]|nr:hypothetical protein [Candidatus Micrarchaeota archaeon]